MRAGTVVEIKSCRPDFMCDRKWQDYLGYCDRFYFAVDSDFPYDLLPADEGLILADRFERARSAGVSARGKRVGIQKVSWLRHPGAGPLASGSHPITRPAR